MTNEKIYKVAKVTTARPYLYSPEIAISGESLSIKDELNGVFLKGYKVYYDGKYLGSVGEVSAIDLGSFNYPSVSSYEIKLRAFGDSFNDSLDSNIVLFKMKGYDRIENEFGTTAVITSNYRIEQNPKKKSAEICTLL